MPRFGDLELMISFKEKVLLRIVINLAILFLLLNRAFTLDEYVDFVKRKYWRENQKHNNIRQIKLVIIEPNVTVYYFNTRYIDLCDQLGTEAI